MFKKFMLVAAFLTAGAGVAAEERACTQMWCQEGLMLQFQGGDWPAGDYSFAITADGETTNCKGSLPFKTCDGSVTCDKQDFRVGESGCALPDGHMFHGIMSEKTPSHLSVTVTRGDGKSFSYDSDVKKQCGFPNGKECDPRECCSAVMDAPVSWN